ncbi:MAG: 2-amino-4-hydroxy-6-hydroxymethyldihydropteridine diphosphokinase [Candidatus Omnitrophota bacterium]
MSVVFIGIGSNLGDRLENINKALDYLKENKNISLEKISSFIETEPVNAPGPKYLNGAIKITTNLPPKNLLVVLQNIEKELGRSRPYKNAPRTIDLDILLYDNEIIDEPELEIPHPKMLGREFVMKPLLEIHPFFKQ